MYGHSYVALRTDQCSDQTMGLRTKGQEEIQPQGVTVLSAPYCRQVVSIFTMVVSSVSGEQNG